MNTRFHARPVLLALTAWWTLSGAAAAAVAVRDLDASVPVTGQELVFLDVSVGSLVIEVGAPGTVTATGTISCSRWSKRCRAWAESLELTVRERGKAIELMIAGYPKTSMGSGPKIDLRVQMPSSLDLEVDLGVGDVEVVGIEGDLVLDLGVGDVDIRMAEGAVREIALDVGVGSADIDPDPPQGQRSGLLFLGNELRWEGGSGRSDVEVDVGVGAVRVRLD